MSSPRPMQPARVYRAPNGTTFTDVEKYRDYMMSMYYSFRKRTDEKLVKLPGDLGGQPMELTHLDGCTVHILDVSSQVSIKGSHNCRIFITPCAGAIIISECTDCVITCAASQLRLNHCERLIINAHVQSGPALEMSKDITFGVFNGSHAIIKQQFRAAGLDEGANAVFDVTDFSASAVEDLGPLPHWRKLDLEDWEMQNTASDDNEQDSHPTLPPAAALAIASILDKFDADGDTSWDYQELNAYQAATGDEDRVADSIEMQRMFAAAGISLDKHGKLRLNALLELYAMQGTDALQRDIVAVGANDIFPGKLPLWSIRLPPGAAPSIGSSTAGSFGGSPTLNARTGAAGAMGSVPSGVSGGTANVAVRGGATPPTVLPTALGRAVGQVTVSMNNKVSLTPPPPPKPAQFLETKRADEDVKAAAPRRSLPRASSKSDVRPRPVEASKVPSPVSGILNELVKAASRDKCISLVGWFRQHDAASSPTGGAGFIRVKEFVRCCLALYFILDKLIDFPVPSDVDSDEEESYVKACIVKDMETFRRDGLEPDDKPGYVNYRRFCATVSSLSAKVSARELIGRHITHSRASSARQSLVSAGALDDATSVTSSSKASLTNKDNGDIANLVSSGTAEMIRGLITSGSGPFLTGSAVRRPSSISPPTGDKKMEAGRGGSDGVPERIITAKTRVITKASAKEREETRQLQRLRLLNRGDAEGLADMLVEDLSGLAKTEKLVRLIRSATSASAYTVDKPYDTEDVTAAPDEYLLVAGIMQLLESVGIRYPLPVVSLALLRLGGQLLISTELAEVLHQPTPAAGSDEADTWAAKMSALCDYSRTVIAKRIFLQFLHQTRRDYLSSKSLPLENWAAKKANEAKAEESRKLRQFRAALASGSAFPHSVSADAWLSKKDVHNFLCQFEIVPDVWINAEAAADAAAYMETPDGRAEVHREVASTGRDEHPSSSDVIQEILAAKTETFVSEYTCKPQKSEDLFWLYVKDIRQRRWPASFDSQIVGSGIPSSPGCELYPDGFERWLQWREYRRRQKASELYRWKTEKHQELELEKAAKARLTSVSAVEQLVKTLASKAQVEAVEGGPILMHPDASDTRRGSVRAVHPSRNGLEIQTRLARLRSKARAPPPEMMQTIALAATAGVDVDQREPDDDNGSVAASSVVGSVISASRLAATSLEPAGRVISQHEFMREFKDVLFSLRADKAASQDARHIADPQGTARRYILARLSQHGDEGDQMRARLEGWKDEFEKRANMLRSSTTANQSQQLDVQAEALRELINEEAQEIVNCTHFREGEEAVMTDAVAAEVEKKQKAQREFNTWLARKEKERRERQARDRRRQQEVTAAKQGRRAKSASAYREWLRSARKKVPETPRPYAHEGLYEENEELMAETAMNIASSLNATSPKNVADEVGHRMDVLAVPSPADIQGHVPDNLDTSVTNARKLNFSGYSLGDDDSPHLPAASDMDPTLNRVQRFAGPISPAIAHGGQASRMQERSLPPKAVKSPYASSRPAVAAHGKRAKSASALPRPLHASPRSKVIPRK